MPKMPEKRRMEKKKIRTFALIGALLLLAAAAAGGYCAWNMYYDRKVPNFSGTSDL